MPEVKTYKCDICGKVYHRSEGETHFMNITHQQLDDDETKRSEFTYICDDCESTILSCIDNPDILKNYREAMAAKAKQVCGYKRLLRKIHHAIYPMVSFWDTYDDPEQYNMIVEHFVSEYQALKAAWDRRGTIIKWISAICGAIIGVLIAFIV